MTLFSPRLTRCLGGLVAGLMLVSLGGCGFSDFDDEPVKVVAKTAKKVKASRAKATMIGDNDPHPGVAEAPSYPVQGIDVSRYQADIDWHRVAGANIRFAAIKATEGDDYIDPWFADNWKNAHAAGVARTAYHFMYWCSTAASQARWFIRNVPVDPAALPPVIDAEWNNHSRTCTKKADPADALEKIRIVSDMLEAHYGKKPIIYTDINFHRDVFAGRPIANPFWLRSTAAEPHERFPGRRWLWWQWTQTGTVPGIAGEVDRNVFYGSESAWLTFLQTGCDPRDASHGCAPTYTASVAPAPIQQPMLAIAGAQPVAGDPIQTASADAPADDDLPMDPLAASFFDE